MKESKAKEGPFPLRLFYEPKEIDDICLEALRKSKFLPPEPAPVKIDIFLEKYFGVVVAYEDLGDGVMGSTVFSSNGAVTGILVARWIEEDGTAAADRRVRSTLAHEGGHGLLHPKLFIVERTGELFPKNPAMQRPRNFLCRNADISPVTSTAPKYDGKWWEWQANRAIGGLLLPKPLVCRLVAQFTEQTQFGQALKENMRVAAEQEVANTFDVNHAVARIRLQEMFPKEKNTIL
jgi:hypothetical protein